MTLEKNFTEEGLELANGDFMVSGCSGIELAHYVLEDQNLDREILRDFISYNKRILVWIKCCFLPMINLSFFYRDL